MDVMDISYRQKILSHERMLDKAQALVSQGRVRRSTVSESRNTWMCSSYSTPKKWYVIRWEPENDCFACGCRAYQFNRMCLHVAACALLELQTGVA